MFKSKPPADQSSIRLYNLALVLQHLHERGPRSRAAIAAESGLNKATISSLVAELVERRLVREVGIKSGPRGRPSHILELDGAAIGAIGLQISPGYLAGLARNLAGGEIDSIRIPFDSAYDPPSVAIEHLREIASHLLTRIRASGGAPLGITIAVAGLVDATHGVILHGNNLHPGWRNLPLIDRLREALGFPNLPIRIENESNLSALAEFWEGEYASASDLIYISGNFGVSSGVIVGGELLRGANGTSGEIGHMMMDPNGPSCSCGRRGCMEALTGLDALLGKLEPGTEGHWLDPEAAVEAIVDRARRKDPTTLDALADVGRWLGLGISTMINLFNPRVVVLGGYFAQVGTWIHDPILTQLRDRVLAPNLGGCQIAYSNLGFGAAMKGGTGLVIDGILTDPGLLAS